MGQSKGSLELTNGDGGVSMHFRLGDFIVVRKSLRVAALMVMQCTCTIILAMMIADEDKGGLQAWLLNSQVNY